VPEQPSPACRWLDIWHKTKSHIWLSHVTSVVIVKQQYGKKVARAGVQTRDLLISFVFSFQNFTYRIATAAPPLLD
jgi:hypothetical protein